MKLIQTIQNFVCSNIIDKNNKQFDELYNLNIKIATENIDLIDERDELKQKSRDLTKTNSKLVEDNNILLNDKFILEQQLIDNNKHSSLITFMNWLKENVKPVSRTHRTSGRIGNKTYINSNIRPHIFFKVTDYDKVMTFAEKVLHWKQFDNEDDLVYKFNVRFDNLFPTQQYYKYDNDLYGAPDYWAGAEITIDKIEKEKTYGDCEDVMILKYCCLKVLLDKYYPNWDTNRLRGFLSWVMGAYYHAVLCWVKEGVNDWIPIETTYYNQRFKDVWINNYTLRNNEIAYKINFSFDDKAEYERI